MPPCKNISHIKVLISYFFPTPPIKLKLRLQIGGRLLIATHLDQLNYLPNQKQGAVNKYDLTVFIRLFESSESCAFFQGHNSLLLDSLDLTAVPHPRFPVQGHILSIGGDVLTASSPDMNAQSFQWIPGGHFVCPADQNTYFTYIINPTIVSVAPLKYSVT
jgi:hypothetical protein